MKRFLGLKIGCIATAILLILSLGKGASAGQRGSTMNFLILGVDEAAENTDVISILRLDSSEGKVTVLQIPRDTYCNADVYGHKINHLFSSARAKGEERDEAVMLLRKFLSEQLSIEFDGHVMLNGADFMRLVDAIGGVEVELDEEIALYNGKDLVLRLGKGKNRLDSKSAMIFVRHRAGYAMGDIDRLRMQRIFAEGLARTVTGSLDMRAIVRLISVFKELETDIPISTAISLIGNRSAYKGVSPQIFTLRGEGIKGENGIWYYALNRYENALLCSEIFKTERESFDSKMRFLNTKEKSFEKIYFRTPEK